MFKLAGEGVYNFPPDKCCTLQKVLHAEAVCRTPADKLEASSEGCFKGIYVLATELSAIFYCYIPQVRRGAL